MSDITSQEVLELFTQAAAVNNSDQFLLHAANLGSGNKAVKVTAEVVRAYLLRKIAITIEPDGYIYIGGENTGFKAEGVTPILKREFDGIYVSSDNGETWSILCYFTDFAATPYQQETETTIYMLMPHVLHVWGDVTSITIDSLMSNLPEGYTDEYRLQFSTGATGATVTLPSEVVWSEEPEFEPNHIYQVSIENNLAIYAGWEKPQAP